MAISAPGIGSGLDIKSIVSQLVALEKQPLSKLQTTASGLQTRLSAFGQLKSQLANLQDQVAKLASPANWGGLTVNSSNSSAVTGRITANSLASISSFSVEVSQLARAQSAASEAVALNTPTGSGTLSISLGQWTSVDHDADPDTPDLQQFAQKADTTAIDIEVGPEDTLSDIAAKINAAGAGVSATLLRDDTGERLLIRSSETGEVNAFRIQASNLGDGSTLGSLAYDPENTPTGMAQSESARNTLATINGVAVSSANNTFSEAIPGVSLTVAAVTTSAATVSVAQNKGSATTNINNFVESFNTLARSLAEMTKFDPATKAKGTLQGDSTAVGLQSALRRMVGGLGPEGTSFSRLSDVGVEFQADGTLKVNTERLNKALENIDDVKTFFSAAGAEGAEGLAVRLRGFTQGMLDSASGTLTTKNTSIQSALERNRKEQDRVSDRIGRVETRLLAQYSRLDSQVASLTALNNYVAQQVTTWNNQRNR